MSGGDFSNLGYRIAEGRKWRAAEFNKKITFKALLLWKSSQGLNSFDPGWNELTSYETGWLELIWHNLALNDLTWSGLIGIHKTLRDDLSQIAIPWFGCDSDDFSLLETIKDDMSWCESTWNKLKWFANFIILDKMSLNGLIWHDSTQY